MLIIVANYLDLTSIALSQKMRMVTNGLKNVLKSYTFSLNMQTIMNDLKNVFKSYTFSPKMRLATNG